MPETLAKYGGGQDFCPTVYYCIRAHPIPMSGRCWPEASAEGAQAIYSCTVLRGAYCSGGTLSTIIHRLRFEDVSARRFSIEQRILVDV